MSQQRQLRPIDQQFLGHVEQGDLRAVKADLAKGADLNVRNLGNANGLTIAIRQEDGAMAELLLNKGIDWQVVDNTSRTPMWIAAEKHNLALVELLLDKGVDPNWPPRDVTEDPTKPKADSHRGFLALHQASVDGDLPIAKALLRGGADHHSQTRMIGRPLYFAVVNGNSDVAAALLSVGADPNGEIMTQVGSRPDTVTYYQQSVLFNLMDKRQAPLLRMCLDAGADIDRTNEKGQCVEEAIASKGGGRAEVLAVYAEYRAMPRLTDSMLATLTKAELFETNDAGYCLMDNPATWRRFSQVAEGLAARGEHLTTSDLEATNSQGKNWLTRGAECFAIKDVLAAYTAAGGALADALLLENGEKSPVLETALRLQQAETVMAADLWLSSGALGSDFRQVYQHVPQEQRADVADYHMTVASLGKEANIGRGR